MKRKLTKRKRVTGFRNFFRTLFLSVRPSFITLGIKDGTVDKKFVDIFSDQYNRFENMVKMNEVSRAEPVKAIATSTGATFTPLGSDTAIPLDDLNLN